LEAKLPPNYVWHSKRIPENVLRPRQRYRMKGELIFNAMT
jgi:hypothetical protein